MKPERTGPTKPQRTGKSAAALGVALAVALGVPAVVAAARPARPGALLGSDYEGPQHKLTRIVDVPFTTVFVEDSSLPADVEVEVQSGIDGLDYVYSTAYADLLGPSRTSVRKEQPRDRVVKVGTKEDLPTATPPPPPQPEPTPEPDPEPPSRGESVPVASLETSGEYGLQDLQFMGVVMWGGYKFTYYSQSVLPGGGLAIPGRHVNAGGFVCDGDGYIVLAGDAPLGTVYATPFGASGKVYDRGTVGNHLDVYTQ